MAEIYTLIKPYLGAETYDALVRNIFNADAELLNVLYEKLTYDKSADQDGVTVVATVMSALKHNEIGKFLAMMATKE